MRHRAQIDWRFTDSCRQFLLLDGVEYRVAQGSPLGNNCLIDSLRQCLDNLECDPRVVRKDLLDRFGGFAANHDAYVGPGNYLVAEEHWQSIVQCLFARNSCGRPTTCNINDYCLIVLNRNNPEHGGNVFGDRHHAPYQLVVANSNNAHFDPCLRTGGASSSSRN